MYSLLHPTSRHSAFVILNYKIYRIRHCLNKPSSTLEWRVAKIWAFKTYYPLPPTPPPLTNHYLRPLQFFRKHFYFTHSRFFQFNQANTEITNHISILSMIKVFPTEYETCKWERQWNLVRHKKIWFQIPQPKPNFNQHKIPKPETILSQKVFLVKSWLRWNEAS